MISKKNKTVKWLVCAGLFTAGCSLFSGCSDFDDYNTVAADAAPSASQTLWENIKGNPQLSDFASLVQKAGFNDELNQTQYYTVWAPLNGTFDASQFQSLNSSALMRQFVKNHIASYAHSASGKIDQRILMLNEKSYSFEGASTYTFDDVALRDANLPSSNGILHTLSGVATFYPNLYEYVTDGELAYGKDIDSLRQFFLRYESTYLDTEASVMGSIVNGMQTYVDSVMVTENTLWNSLNAKINHEDSSYTFLLPTNEAWTKTYDKVKSFYNYLPSTKIQTFVSGKLADTQVAIDNGYWQDSIACRYLTRNLIFSNNDPYNQWLVKAPSAVGSDTLRTTTRRKLSNPADILGQTRETLKMSNGVARIVDSLAFYPWETYAPEMRVAAYSSGNQARVMTGYPQKVDVKNPDPAKVDVSGPENNGTMSYLWVEPNSGFAKPELDLYLPNVLSTTYDIYCVFVPSNVEQGDTVAPLPNRVIFTLNYCDENGVLKDHVFLDESEENINSFQEKFNLKDNNTNGTTIRGFSNDISKVDTLYIGQFTFPVSYYGLGDGNCPNIKITSPFSVFNASLLASFSRDLRIAAIILKPRELAEFEESHKQ